MVTIDFVAAIVTIFVIIIIIHETKIIFIISNS